MIPLAMPIIGPDERDAVDRVLRSGVLTQGPEVLAFEGEFSQALVRDRHCVAVNSGTSALLLSLIAIGVGRGDEVIVPSFSFAATANAVVLAGAKPVFVDIEPEHFCLSPAAVEAAITSHTAAIMPVHLYGHPAEMTALQAIAAKHALAIVEDAAQAHGAAWRGVPVGCFGTVAAFSFYPTKNMTTGEGGMVVTGDAGVADRVKLLRNQGMERRYENELIGYNMRMTDVSAAIGRVQLTKLAGWTESRRRNAMQLSAGLPGLVTPPKTSAAAAPVFHQYTVRVQNREALRRELEAAGVGTGVYYPVPIHRLPSFRAEVDLPQTDRAAHEVLSLPVHPSLSPRQLGHVVHAVCDAVGR
jgi:perosamine synthetase